MNNGLKLWEILEGIIGKNESIVGSGLFTCFATLQQLCDDPCCNATTCQLADHAVCSNREVCCSNCQVSLVVPKQHCLELPIVLYVGNDNVTL